MHFYCKEFEEDFDRPKKNCHNRIFLCDKILYVDQSLVNGYRSVSFIHRYIFHTHKGFQHENCFKNYKLRYKND